MKEKKARVEDAHARHQGGRRRGHRPRRRRRAAPRDRGGRQGQGRGRRAGSASTIVKRALEEPTRQIVDQRRLEGSVIVNDLKEKGGNWGFNAQTEEIVDMIAAGIIDPAKVTSRRSRTPRRSPA